MWDSLSHFDNLLTVVEFYTEIIQMQEMLPHFNDKENNVSPVCCLVICQSKPIHNIVYFLNEQFTTKSPVANSRTKRYSHYSQQPLE